MSSGSAASASLCAGKTQSDLDQRGTAVHLSGVRKEFVAAGREPVTALEHVDLAIEPGQFVSVLGPSGCGKSTLLSIMAGLDRATAGEVRVDRRLVQGAVTEAGFVFQRDLLLDWRTCEKNVLLQFQLRGQSAKPHAAKARSLLERVGLGGFVDRHPWELSGGMRQRVAICRALVHDPPLLFMDEPFGALDALTREDLNLELSTLMAASQATVIFVTHGIDEAVFLSDRVLVMSPRPGRIVADLAINLPRPRHNHIRRDPEFVAIAGHLRDLLAGSPQIGADRG